MHSRRCSFTWDGSAESYSENGKARVHLSRAGGAMWHVGVADGAGLRCWAMHMAPHLSSRREADTGTARPAGKRRGQTRGVPPGPAGRLVLFCTARGAFVVSPKGKAHIRRGPGRCMLNQSNVNLSYNARATITLE